VPVLEKALSYASEAVLLVLPHQSRLISNLSLRCGMQKNIAVMGWSSNAS
jgi:hypothetical protein